LLKKKNIEKNKGLFWSVRTIKESVNTKIRWAIKHFALMSVREHGWKITFTLEDGSLTDELEGTVFGLTWVDGES
jgi:hypothetical protein